MLPWKQIGDSMATLIGGGDRLLAINTSGLVVRYDDSMPPTAGSKRWQQLDPEMVFATATAGPGWAAGLAPDKSGEVLMLQNSSWVRIGGPMASLIGGGDVPYAIDTAGCVLRYENVPTKWTKIGTPALQFAAGRGWLAGIFPATVSKTGRPPAKPGVSIYRNGQWFPIPNPTVNKKVGKVVVKAEVILASLVGGGDVLYGIDAGGQPWRLNQATLAWGLIGGASPGAQYAAGPGGRLARSDKSGVSLYYNSRWMACGTPMDAIAVVGGKVFGLQPNSEVVCEAGPTPARISYATEFMRDYQHAVAMPPPAQYRVAQTPQGRSLIFFTSTDGLLNCTRELPNHPQGWEKSDLTPGLASAVSRVFPRKKFTVKTFDLLQPPKQQFISLAAVVTVDGGDYLFSGQVNFYLWDGKDLRISWDYLAFDDTSGPKPVTSRSIVGIDLSASYNSSSGVAALIGTPILVDVLRDRTNPNSGAAQYVVTAFGHRPLTPGLLDVPYYRSVGGKLVPQFLSVTGHRGNVALGVYSVMLDGTASPVTCRTMDPLNGTPKTYFLRPRNLGFTQPVDPIPTAMALNAREIASSGGSGCDLFVIAHQSLYFLSRDADVSLAGGRLLSPIYTDDLLRGATSLRVTSSSTTTIICGINRQGQVFFLQSPAGKEGSSEAWSSPVVVLTGAVDLASVMLTASGTCVLFAHTEGTPDGPALIQLTRDAVTGVWIQRHVLLSPSSADDIFPPVSAATPGNVIHGDGGVTYSTRVKATDEDGQPIPNLSLGITSTSPCSVYINQKYCLLGSTPTYVATDALGALNIVQEVDSLGAACYAVSPSPAREISLASDPAAIPVKRIAINPMSAIVDTLKTVRSAAQLPRPAASASTRARGATASVTEADRANTASLILQCVPLIGQMPQDGSWVTPVPATRSARRSVRDRVFGIDYTKGAVYFERTPPSSRRGVGKWIKHHLHDAFKHLTHLIHKVERIVVKVVGKVVSFIIKIAEDTYEVVANCIHDIIHFIDFVLRKIELGIEDLLRWLGKVFPWDAIVENQKVLMQVINLSVTDVVAKLDGLKGALDHAFDQLLQPITEWAGIDALRNTVTTASAFKGLDLGHELPSAHWALKHLAAHATSVTSSYRPPNLTANRDLQKAFDALAADFKSEVGVLGDTVRQFYEIARNLSSLSLPELTRRIAGLLTVEGLSTAKNGLKFVIDVLQLMADLVKDALNAPIHIPVLSKLYKLYVGSDLTVLSSIALVISVPLTVIARTLGNNIWGAVSADAILRAPDMDAIRRMISAHGWHGKVSASGQISGTRSSRGGPSVLRVDGWTFAWNCVGAVASAAVLILTTSGAALAAPGAEVDGPAWEGNAKLLAAANIFYAAPGLLSSLLPALLPPYGGGVDLATHAGKLVIINGCGAFLSGLSMLKGVADLGGMPDPVSAAADLVLGFLGVFPTVAALAVDQTPQTGFAFASGLPSSLGGMLAPVYLASVAGIVGGELAAEVTSWTGIGLLVSGVVWAGAETTLAGVVTVQDGCALLGGGFLMGSSFVPGPGQDGNPKQLGKTTEVPRKRRPAGRGVRRLKSRG